MLRSLALVTAAALLVPSAAFACGMKRMPKQEIVLADLMEEIDEAEVEEAQPEAQPEVKAEDVEQGEKVEVEATEDKVETATDDSTS